MKPTNELSDFEIVEKVRAGNQHLFRILIQRYQVAVRTTIAGMIGYSQDVEDVAQSVFVRFYNSIDQFKGQSALKTYLTKIAINLSLNHIKSTTNRRQKKSDFESHQLRNTRNDTSAETSFELKEVIFNEISKLDKNFRSVLVLRLVEGYSTKETAEMLEIPMGTVGSRLKRAQEELQKKLKKFI